MKNEEQKSNDANVMVASNAVDNQKQKKWMWSTKQNGILRAIIILIALFFDFGLRLLPVPSGMTADAFALIGIFVGTLLLWLTISIDWPSILCLFALTTLKSFGFSNAFSSSFGNSTWIFLLFTFVCTYAVSKTPIIKRIALWFVNGRFAKKSGWGFAISFLSSVLILGMFMSPTVLFVVLMPILEEILNLAKIEKGEKAGTMLYVGMAFAVSISSGMTPIAHVFPILAMSQAGGVLNYFSYMAFAVPVGVIVFALLLLLFWLVLRPDLSKLKKIDCKQMANDLPKADLRESLTVGIFCFVILMWLMQSLFGKNGVAGNKTMTIFLGTIFFAVLLAVLIAKIAKHAKQRSKDAVFDLACIGVLATFAIAMLVLKICNVWNFFEWLNATNIAVIFCLLAASICVLIGMLKKAFATKSKKMLVWSSAMLGICVVLICLCVVFQAQTNSIFDFLSGWNNAMPAILGTLLLCIVRVDKKSLVNIGDAFKNGIPWASLVMCAGTLGLGAAMSNSAIGLNTFLKTNLQSNLANVSGILLVCIFVIWALVQTNLSSNMVTATLVSSVAVSVIGSAGTVDLNAMVAIVGMLSAFAFATPPSMPHIAITASSGYATTKDCLKFGMLLMLLSAIVAVAIGYPLAMLVL